jgi:hypothetical protein
VNLTWFNHQNLDLPNSGIVHNSGALDAVAALHGNFTALRNKEVTVYDLGKL